MFPQSNSELFVCFLFALGGGLITWFLLRICCGDDYEAVDPRQRNDQVVTQYAVTIPAQCNSCKFNEIWFFPEDVKLCYSLKRSYCQYDRCGYLHAEDNPRSNFVRLARAVESARTQICLCMFSLTSIGLSRILCDLRKRGVDIKVITDANQRKKNTGDQTQELRNAGIQVKEYRIPQDPSASKSSNSHLMHHKFIIIDRKLLITGSFNWSFNAAFHNYELLIKTGQPELVRQCLATFNKMWQDNDRIFDIPFSYAIRLPSES